VACFLHSLCAGRCFGQRREKDSESRSNLLTAEKDLAKRGKDLDRLPVFFCLSYKRNRVYDEQPSMLPLRNPFSADESKISKFLWW
jgi:hypothetical protein